MNTPVRSGVCPYCGGPYTLAKTCHGPRTDQRGENACPDMARVSLLIHDALDDYEEEERI